jgi:acetyl-CoA carboxylase carboxyl transferase subunit alpha
LQVIDSIINEPLGGAHHNPSVVYQNVKQFISEQWHALRRIPPDVLIERRYLKFRRIGQFLEQGVQ